MIISEYPLNGLSCVCPEDFLSSKYPLRRNELIINLCHDLRFLKSGYYVSLYAMGHRVIPAIEDLSDLYCPPSVFRRLEGRVPMIMPKILDEAPGSEGKVIIFPLNQLNRERYFIASDSEEKQRYYERASLYHRFPIAVLPLRRKLQEVSVIFGDCIDKDKYKKHVAKQIYGELQIPIFKLLMQSREFSGVLPCSLKELNSEERELLIQKLSTLEGGY